jgi:protein-tyrosine phosphatase
VRERRVQLAGPLNFRDLGGYATNDGRTTSWGRVFRSDSLHHLTPEDGPRLAEIGITTAIDFRADDELEEIGIGGLGELDIRHVHLPTVDKVLHTIRPPDWVPPESAAEVYLLMLRSGAGAYAEALRALTVPGALPAVYFCMAGKDRTGVFSAILLGLLGVGDDDIIADYALTHDVVEQIHDRRRQQGRGEPEDVWRGLPTDLHGAHAATMERTLHGLRKQWGGIEDYVRDIGVSAEVVDTLRAELVE